MCRPKSVLVVTDDPAETELVRRRAIEKGEETPLSVKGHTVHFDGYFDLARDVGNTRYLVSKNDHLDSSLNQTERKEGLQEQARLLRNSMEGKEMIVRFFSLAPPGSPFAILATQVTDSYYVAHSLDLLYRPAYSVFKQIDPSVGFFMILHSAGVLTGGVSANASRRRVYIDLKRDTVYSVNTQYAGNTLGLKKLAFRLAIRKADREGWLAEHMFIMGVHGPNGRKTYFTGAYPSACGKTSTSMVRGETIVGDDLAYLRVFDGQVRAANVECGIFGIIQGVNEKDDPAIFESLTTPGEVVFSNVLVNNGTPYWLDDGRQHPETGTNYFGQWREGVLGPDGSAVPLAHKNARYTLRLRALKNLDSEADNPSGVPVGGVIYGGRNSDTSVPVREAFSWQHGVITIGAALESDTTSATLGKEGVRSFQPFSNIDFMSIPVGRYINNHLEFARRLRNPPRVFGVNYFLTDEHGAYISSKDDKRVWLKWMEFRVHSDVEAIRTPIGLIPHFEDLKTLFKDVLGKTYSVDDYARQFAIRVENLLSKNRRVGEIYRRGEEVPSVVLDELGEEEKRLLEAQARFGNNVSPEKYL